MYQLLWERISKSYNFCPIIVVTFTCIFHSLYVSIVRDRSHEIYKLCPIIVVTFAYIFHTLNVSILMRQK